MQRVLIVGGGIAGLSVMRFLNKLDFEVKLIEKAPQLRASGAGIMLGINAMKLLDKLGLAEQVIQQGQALSAFSMVDAKGKHISVSDALYMESQTGYKTVAIHRRELHAILSQGMDIDKIKLNTTVTELNRIGGTMYVTYSDDQQDEFDLVIAADGLY